MSSTGKMPFFAPAYPAYKVEYNVLARNVGRELAFERDPYRVRYSEPQLARLYRIGEVGRPDARRERADRAVGACVRVRADYEHLGQSQALFGQERVFDAHFAYVEEVFYAVLFGKFAAHDALPCARYVLVRREMVEDYRYFVGIGDLATARRLERLDRDGAGYIVAEREVDVRHYHFARGEALFAAVCG